MVLCLQAILASIFRPLGLFSLETLYSAYHVANYLKEHPNRLLNCILYCNWLPIFELLYIHSDLRNIDTWIFFKVFVRFSWEGMMSFHSVALFLSWSLCHIPFAKWPCKTHWAFIWSSDIGLQHEACCSLSWDNLSYLACSYDIATLEWPWLYTWYTCHYWQARYGRTYMHIYIDTHICIIYHL